MLTTGKRPKQLGGKIASIKNDILWIIAIHHNF
jgi:hypothetical protein